MYKDTIELIKGGVNDKKCNLFYIRPNKHTSRKSSLSTLIRSYRVVFQLSDKISRNDSLMALAGFMDEFVSSMTITENSDLVYFEEYKKERSMKGFYLIAIDFTFIEEYSYSNCNCLNMGSC